MFDTKKAGITAIVGLAAWSIAANATGLPSPTEAGREILYGLQNLSPAEMLEAGYENLQAYAQNWLDDGNAALGLGGQAVSYGGIAAATPGVAKKVPGLIKKVCDYYKK